MLITLFEWIWVLVLSAALALLGIIRLIEHTKKHWHQKGLVRYTWKTIKGLLLVIIGISIIGVYLTTIPANETFTYMGHMEPVSEKFDESFQTPFQYVYVQNGFINHEGQRFFLNLARFTMPYLSFESRSGTVYAYRTAQENRLVGLDAQRESYDNMVLAAFNFAGRPLEYEKSYTVLTTYAQFESASNTLQAGDQLIAYDGIMMDGRSELGSLHSRTRKRYTHP